MFVIGLTGNIASGKTAVAERLRALGARVICADRVAREVVRPGTEGARRVREAFGGGVFRLDGSLDRAALGRIVFFDEAQRHKLEAILHSLIVADVRRTLAAWETQTPDAVAVVDAALLIEVGLHAAADEVWLVEAPDDQRLRRIMLRDGLDETEARARMASQSPTKEKRRYAHHILSNDGSNEKLLAQVDALWADAAARLAGEK